MGFLLIITSMLHKTATNETKKDDARSVRALQAYRYWYYAKPAWA